MAKVIEYISNTKRDYHIGDLVRCGGNVCIVTGFKFDTIGDGFEFELVDLSNGVKFNADATDVLMFLGCITLCNETDS